MKFCIAVQHISHIVFFFFFREREFQSMIMVSTLDDILLSEREIQLIASTSNDISLLLNQDTNQFLV